MRIHSLNGWYVPFQLAGSCVLGSCLLFCHNNAIIPCYRRGIKLSGAGDALESREKWLRKNDVFLACRDGEYSTKVPEPAATQIAEPIPRCRLATISRAMRVNAAEADARDGGWRNAARLAGGAADHCPRESPQEKRTRVASTGCPGPEAQNVGFAPRRPVFA